MKVLFVGEYHNQMYAAAFLNAAKEVRGIEADPFDTELLWNKVKPTLLKRVQRKYLIGKTIICINRTLKETILRGKYDIVFLYNTRYITGKTVKEIKQHGVYVATYSNDNPFSEYYEQYYWRYWKGQARECDICYVYRKSNIIDVKKLGNNNVSLLLPYYISCRNYYISRQEDDKNIPEVVFLGHKEDDERYEYLSMLVKSGVKIGIQDNWKDFCVGSPLVQLLSSDQSVYNDIINCAKIAVVFLSKINHDTYTRRCFEIPATKTMMIAPYTEDLAKMFEEDKEIVFYRNKDEFVEKTKYYLDHPAERKAIGEAGYQRLMRDGHESKDRVRQIISDYYKRHDEG